ncbi:HAD family hydrolase [Rubritalea marina]|uniref:HAD family hydrolase n=1 Tax=Rubritalea marina TaxID=361055 RepID=UPI00039B2981|nr:HAD family hydrolase [Rubritalea marina]
MRTEEISQDTPSDWSWIFDWSGTLVDDLALVVSATNYVMRHYGKPEWEREAFRRSFRLPYNEFYEECLEGVDLSELETHFRLGFDLSDDPVPALPHAREFLEFLRGHGCQMYVLTSMSTLDFHQQARDLQLDQYFSKTYSGVLDKRDVISSIVSDHGIDSSRCVFVGDMTHDVETAHHGGILSAGVLTGYNHRAVLESVDPSYLVNDLLEFRQALEQVSNWSQLFQHNPTQTES